MVFIDRIKKNVKGYIPYKLVEYRRKHIHKNHPEIRARIEKEFKIKDYFHNLKQNNMEPEILEIVEYLENNLFSIYPYSFSKKYHAAKIKVYYDKKSKMRYVLHEYKRLYFPEAWNTYKIRDYYNSLCTEQDIDSPHRYETPEYTVKDGDIIADIGTAEGIWALTNVERARKIYLFECNKEYINALEKTFEPWKEKVVIVNKYISNVNQGEYITLDDFINGGEINFIKADIEGMELELLEGGIKTVTKAVDLKLLLCTYHRKNDAENLRRFLEGNGFITEHSKRYMLFIYDNELDEPYIRRGIIRATKMTST